MGFRPDAYATLWEVRPTKSDKVLSGRITISRKLKDGTYEDEFNQWVKLIGNARMQGSDIKSRTRIKIIDCDVKAPYDYEKGETKYYDWVIYDFEVVGGSTQSAASAPAAKPKASPAKKPAFNDEGDVDDEDVPF